MITKFTRRGTIALLTASALTASTSMTAFAAEGIQLRLSTSGSESGQRAQAMLEAFGLAVADFAEYLPAYNGSMFAQGTELEAISRGNLEMAFMSAQEAAQFFPEFSIFSAGYVMQDAAHQVAVYNDPVMDQFKQGVEDELGIKMLATVYFGRRQLNLRQSKDELTVSTPADRANIRLRTQSVATKIT